MKAGARRAGSPRGAKRFEFAASVARDGSLCAEGKEVLDPGEAWTPEHLLLAAVCRCTLASLRHHANRAGVEVSGTASASGVVTRRDSDGRYGFVEVLCGLDVVLDPAPDDLRGLLAAAERDCFISASLSVAPEYEWRVNGELAPAELSKRAEPAEPLLVRNGGVGR